MGKTLLLRFQLDRRRVDAVAQTSRLGPVVEKVPQVPAAVGTRHLGPDHEMRAVDRLLDRGSLGRRVEARPSAVGVELGLGLEQPRAAAGAKVQTRSLGVPVLARERPLRALLAQDVKLQWAQVSLPLGFALLDFALLHRLLISPQLLTAKPPALGLHSQGSFTFEHFWGVKRCRRSIAPLS